MEMINVLNTIPETNLMYVALFFILTAIISTIGMFVFQENLFTASVIVLMISVFGIIMSVSLSNPITYECTIKEDTKAINFLQTFTITEHRGDIYKVVLNATQFGQK